MIIFNGWWESGGDPHHNRQILSGWVLSRSVGKCHDNDNDDIYHYDGDDDDETVTRRVPALQAIDQEKRVCRRGGR